MVFGMGAKGAREEDVNALLAKKNYARAIEVIKSQLATRKNDPRVRMQLADVLLLAGKAKEAIPILMPVADEYARDGFAAKAISVLKKIQKLDPTRRDVEKKLAELIEEKQRTAVSALPLTPAPQSFEIGMEEIGFEPIAAGPPAAPSRREPVAPAAVSQPAPIKVVVPEEPAPAVEITPEITFAAPAGAPSFSAGSEAPVLDQAEPERAGGEFALGSGEDELVPAAAFTGLSEGEITLTAEAPVSRSPGPAPVEDDDIFALTGEDELVEITPEPEIQPEAAAPGPGSMDDFASELMGLVDEAFKDLPLGEDGGPPIPDTGGAGGTQIVVSPLFKNLSVEELVAIIHGLNLITFERGQVIIREGQAGDSLFMLTAGTVNAFKKREGKQVRIAELDEGEFFGEISILTGRPRTATIVAASHCELLELDRTTLDGIVAQHPHVWTVMQEFCEQRLKANA